MRGKGSPQLRLSMRPFRRSAGDPLLRIMAGSDLRAGPVLVRLTPGDFFPSGASGGVEPSDASVSQQSACGLEFLELAPQLCGASGGAASLRKGPHSEQCCPAAARSTSSSAWGEDRDEAPRTRERAGSRWIARDRGAVRHLGTFVHHRGADCLRMSASTRADRPPARDAERRAEGHERTVVTGLRGRKRPVETDALPLNHARSARSLPSMAPRSSAWAASWGARS